MNKAFYGSDSNVKRPMAKAIPDAIRIPPVRRYVIRLPKKVHLLNCFYHASPIALRLHSPGRS
ncbi:MAG: hypothetical protein ACKO0N_08315, partial [Planctomycetota bacterium]